MHIHSWLITIWLLAACNNPEGYRTIGSIERVDPALDSIIDGTAKIEVIADGMDWSEGPLWLPSENKLIFSDVPRDTVFSWSATKGKEVYLTHSGYTDTVKRGGEMGSNGLALDKNGKLLLCQCGNRQVARMEAGLSNPSAVYTSLARQYLGKKFNSPNDLVVNSKGEIFFTDPPYGLEKNMHDPKKELSYQGVFKIKTNSEVVLLTDTITRPNGILLMPGENILLVSNSDPFKPNWYAFDITGDSLKNGRIFYSCAGYDKKLKGLPDGMKVDRNGNVFATGPGGIWIFNSQAKLLGKIKVPDATSNCAFSPDEKILYVTNDGNILRIQLRK
jgi:gluconolactonase